MDLPTISPHNTENYQYFHYQLLTITKTTISFDGVIHASGGPDEDTLASSSMAGGSHLIPTQFLELPKADEQKSPNPTQWESLRTDSPIRGHSTDGLKGLYIKTTL
jgi:hypothetical protein